MTDFVQTKATSDYLSIPLPVSDLETEIVYNVDGNVETMTVHYMGIDAQTGETVQSVAYTQTFTYDGVNVTDLSQWVPQS